MPAGQSAPSVLTVVEPDPRKTDLERLLNVLFERRESTAVSGPLPPPDLAQKYEDILPGFLDRQVRLQQRRADLADKQTAIVEQVVAVQHDARPLGQRLAALAAFGFLVLAGFVAIWSPWADAVIPAFDVSGLTLAFVLGPRQAKAQPPLDRPEDQDSDGADPNDPPA